MSGFRQLAGTPPKRVKHAGYSFASKLEAALFDILKSKEVAGEVSDIKVQPKVYLTDARILMIPDFSVIENGFVVYYEAKGVQTDVWRIKRRLWQFYGPAPLRVYMGSHRRLFLSEELVPPTATSVTCR
jgi:hypothetical protein